MRIVRGRISWWGEHNGKADRWQRQGDSAVRWDDETVHGVRILGLRIQSPRYPANTWQETNLHDQELGYGLHPWGGQAVFPKAGSIQGGQVVTDSSFVANRLRNFNDTMGGGNNQSPDSGGFGSNFVCAHTYMEGWADDGFEHEGTGSNALLLNLYMHSQVLRNYTWVPFHGIGIETAWWGPTTVERVAVALRDNGQLPADDYIPFKEGRGFKSQRKDPAWQGWIDFAHVTLFGDMTMRGFMAGNQYIQVKNSLFATKGNLSGGTPSDISNNRHETTVDALPGFEPGSAVPETHVAGAIELWNINDAGPWGSPSPSLGAQNK